MQIHLQTRTLSHKGQAPLWKALGVGLAVLFLLASCSSKVRYQRPHISYQKDPTDMPELLEPMHNYKLTRKSPQQKARWKEELAKAKSQTPQGTMEYDMYVAHCLGNLDEYEKSAEYYLQAAKKAKDPKLKRKFRIAAVQALGRAGMLAEEEGDVELALRLYKRCNEYCKRFGFELHVPHSRMDRLSQDGP